MKKTAQKPQPQPMTLGTKRICPKCSTKFYDFNKAELNCPKCETALSIDELSQMTRTPIELKKPAKAAEKSEDPLLQGEELATDEAETFESVDDLNDDDEDIVEDLEVDEEEQE